MTIQLTCQFCQSRLRVSASYAGKKVRCPTCRQVTTIPHRETPEALTPPAVGQTGAFQRVASPGGSVRSSPRYDAHFPPATETADLVNDELDFLDFAPDLDDDPDRAVVRDGGILEERRVRQTQAQPSEPVSATLGYRLEVDLEAQRVVLAMHRGDDVFVTKQQILENLALHQVRHGIDHDKISLALMFLGYPEECEEGTQYCIAEGLKPTEGQPGRVEYFVDVTGEAKVDKTLEDGEERVNFKAMAQIETVTVGQRLATYHPPVVGVAGVGLDGDAIHPDEPDELSFHCGEGVRFVKDTGCIYATRDGRPILSGDTISVVQIYEIPGNVDYSTGNIKFDGHVVVRGNVSDDFVIDCKSLEVHGTTGSAKIRAAADAHFLGGVNGQQRGRLQIGGHCIAKYLNEVSARVAGNLSVERGITSSEIGCMGEIVAERIVGGSCHAYLGFELNYLGSDLGVVTTVFPGSSYRERDLIDAIQDADSDIEGLSKRASPYLNQGPEFERLSEEKQCASREAFEALTAVRQRREALAQRLESLQDTDGQPPVVMVNIGSQLFADVIVATSAVSREFTEARGGKMTIRIDEESGTFGLDTYKRRPIKRAHAAGG